MSVTLVSYTVDGHVARITLDSPHNRNAMSARLVAQLHDGLRQAAADPAVRAVVLGHTGGTFCAGADLSEASSGDPFDAALGRAREMTALLRAIIECPMPVIAAIDGHVRAGGMGLIGACDMVVAGPRSSFALTEVRIGVAPAIISLTLLPKLSQASVAEAALKTCEEIDRLESDADRVMRSAMSKLFRDNIEVRELIKLKAVYEHLESISDRCEDVANIVEGIVLENS